MLHKWPLTHGDHADRSKIDEMNYKMQFFMCGLGLVSQPCTTLQTAAWSSSATDT